MTRCTGISRPPAAAMLLLLDAAAALLPSTPAAALLRAVAAAWPLTTYHAATPLASSDAAGCAATNDVMPLRWGWGEGGGRRGVKRGGWAFVVPSTRLERALPLHHSRARRVDGDAHGARHPRQRYRLALVEHPAWEE
jgi:hypothetical protein